MRAALSENPVADLRGKLPQQVLKPGFVSRTDPTRKIAIALSIFAAIRILVFVLAFPLFNNVDEKWHFLAIQMYAEGHLPGKDLPKVDKDFGKTFLPYWSQEYISDPEFMIHNASVPLYRLSTEARSAALAHGYYAWKLEDLQRRINFEAQGPPLYYIVAGGWYNVGEALGLHSWQLAYWVRLLNPISYGLLVWLSYKITRRVYPQHQFLCLAVPALIAVFPQDVFFGMNRDVLSPTLWAAALLLMLDAVGLETLRYGPLLLASFLVGLTFLVEISNCVLYIALATALGIWLNRSEGTLRDKAGMVSACVAAACLPPLLWMTRNYLVIGDFTGSKAKIAYFGWAVKPLRDIFHHQIFSLHGFSFFLVKLTREFWRGEYVWQAVPMRSRIGDWFYVISSAVLLTIFVFNLANRRKTIPRLQRFADFQALFLVGCSVLFMAAMTLPFDFRDCPYPSRLDPYFCGRIISGAILPFVVMYAIGLEFVTDRLRTWISPTAVLACVMLLITASELRVRWPVFSDQYNFFAISLWHG